MSKTPSELIDWIEEINRHRKEELEAIRVARRR